MAIDQSKVMALLNYLEGTIEETDQMHVTRNKLEEDIRFAASVKYFVQTAVECCANIAEHIVFGLNLGHPETTKELFPILYKENIIEEVLSEKLKDAVGLRNILIHQYLDVDLGILAESATVDLSDLRDFAKAINEFLEKQG